MGGGEGAGVLLVCIYSFIWRDQGGHDPFLYCTSDHIMLLLSCVTAGSGVYTISCLS